MSISTDSGLYHRMPAAFGAAMGPRQFPHGVAIDDATSHRRTTVSAAFQVAGPLEHLLPPGFRLRGEPLLVIEFGYMREIEWLAGRGYNLAGVKIPCTFRAGSGDIHGMFYAVLWESLADPILTGREELGVPKLFAEIPEPRVFQGMQDHGASWLGFPFLDLSVQALRAETPDDRPVFDAGAGMLQWKYVPRTGAPGQADVSCITFTPAANPAMKIISRHRAQAQAAFHRARWQDLPTMFHIVNALADLPLRDCVGCTVTESRGMKTLGDTRVVG
jgi:hypothetical protein